MKGIIAIIGLLVILTLVPIMGLNDACAECQQKASCSAEDDTGPSTLCESGSYDPCDSWMSWDVYFHRNGEWIQTTTRFEVYGSGWYRDYYALVWAEGNYHDYGSVYVGPSSDHNARIRRTYGTGGAFEDLTLAVTYYADDPTK